MKQKREKKAYPWHEVRCALDRGQTLERSGWRGRGGCAAGCGGFALRLKFDHIRRETRTTTHCPKVRNKHSVIDFAQKRQSAHSPSLFWLRKHTNLSTRSTKNSNNHTSSAASEPGTPSCENLHYKMAQSRVSEAWKALQRELSLPLCRRNTFLSLTSTGMAS